MIVGKAIKKKKTVATNARINFIGGPWDEKTLVVVYPSPPWIVVNMGQDLYKRRDSIEIVEAAYVHHENWDEYNQFLNKNAYI